MDAGDAMRRAWSEHMHGDTTADAVALAAIIAIRQKREEINNRRGVTPLDNPDERKRRDLTQIPADGVAYLIDSIKHPDELDWLRSVYGPAFISVSIYSPPSARRAFLARKSLAADVELRLERLLERDARGDVTDDKLGQRVSDAFDITDFLVDATLSDQALSRSMQRLVALIFGDVFLTPELDEFGMYMARASQARSASLARQIGAAILRDDGSVIAVGTNEVAKPITGGQYWPPDDAKFHGRDFVYSDIDTSDEFRADMLRDLLDRLASAAVLIDKYRDGTLTLQKRLEALLNKADADLPHSVLYQNIDYIRAVHAEAASLLDCARHGVAVHGARMFTTTFPCHECARHIVAAGLKEVIYLEPYPKSGTSKLFSDSIDIDPATPNPDKVTFRTFVGVAPARYLEFFALGDRKRKDDATGKRLKFSLGEKSSPRLPYYAPTPDAVVYNELNEVSQFVEFLEPHQASPTPQV